MNPVPGPATLNHDPPPPPKKNTRRFEANSEITGMVSVEGELIPLKTRIKPHEANGAVEKWLVQARPLAPPCRPHPLLHALPPPFPPCVLRVHAHVAAA